MSVREYIGARYVPTFSDPIEWDSTSSYEPLTVVMNLGASYVSKQSVPAGIQITNEDYWIKWADYNAQLEHYIEVVETFDARIDKNADDIVDINDKIGGDYSSEATVDDAIDAINDKIGGDYSSEATVDDAIDAINDKIGGSYTPQSTVDDAIDANATAISEISAQFDDIKNVIKGNVVMIGDSYGQGWTPDGTVTGWPNLVSQVLNSYGIDTHYYSVGGAGFASGTTYLSVLQTLTGTLTEAQKEKVGTIVICGGANDRGQSEANITSGMALMKAYILQQYPNVKKVLVGNVGMIVEGLTTGVWANATFAQMADCNLNYNNSIISSQLGAIIPNGISVLRHNGYFSSDYVHPNLAGQKQIAQYVISALMGVEFKQNTPLVFMANVFAANIQDNMLHVYTAANKQFSSLNITHEFTSADSATIATFNKNATFQLRDFITVPSAMMFHGATTSGGSKNYYTLPGSLVFKKSGDIKFKCIAANAAGNGYLKLYDIDDIQTCNGLTDFIISPYGEMH